MERPGTKPVELRREPHFVERRLEPVVLKRTCGGKEREYGNRHDQTQVEVKNVLPEPGAVPFIEADHHERQKELRQEGYVAELQAAPQSGVGFAVHNASDGTCTPRAASARASHASMSGRLSATATYWAGDMMSVRSTRSAAATITSGMQRLVGWSEYFRKYSQRPANTTCAPTCGASVRQRDLQPVRRVCGRDEHKHGELCAEQDDGHSVARENAGLS